MWTACCLAILLQSPFGVAARAQTTKFHLTARPWHAAPPDHNEILDLLDGLCRFSVRHQAPDGAIIDVFLQREVQYSTPYFAYAVGTLVRAGRSRDLLPHGIAAMEHSTIQFALGRNAIPDQHGEFFIAVLTEALDVYKGLVPDSQIEEWRSRLKTPLPELIGPNRNNWMTYAMKGEWLRSTHGLVSHEDAVKFIEQSWKDEQRGRIVPTPFHLYHDRSSDPDTLSVETVGRGNLLALIAEGYDGPSAQEMRSTVFDGSGTALFLQDPTGQLPANGRTDDHVWADVGQSLVFQVMANEESQLGNAELAGQFQEASNLVIPEIRNYLHTDGDWVGSLYITKNHFDPGLRVGYQDASHIGNYTGSSMFHLAELYNQQRFSIAQQPTPAERGGYVIALDPSFDTVIANAGGLQVQIDLRGQTTKQSGNFWTPLGIVRISRSGWDSRLGPSDGALTPDGGVTFGPAFLENDAWRRMADLSGRYRAEWRTEIVNPVLVRGVIAWRPLPGQIGPAFETTLWITPDGIFSETSKTGADPLPWAVTWPLLVNDGRPLDVQITSSSGSTSFQPGGDVESFLAVGQHTKVESSAQTLRSSYGDLLAARAVTSDDIDRTFIYPHHADSPSVEAVEQSFHRTAGGFTTVLGQVEGDQYIGDSIAGGEGSSLSLVPGTPPSVTFERRCNFLAQREHDKIAAIEVDRDVVAHVANKRIALKAYQPVRF